MPEPGPFILVVDDDAVTRRILVGYLERAGFRAEVVADGTAALERCAASAPALVLLDLMLPPADGFAVLQSLRERPATRDVPVVVLTALDRDDGVERAFAAGADDFLRKPVREAELLARIRSQLRARAYLADLARKERDAHALLELTRALASSLDVQQILALVVRRVAEVVQVERCSVVVAREADSVGHVLAASDDAALHNLPIDLAKYPEIQRVLQVRQPLTIDDATSHPMFWALRERLSNTAFPSLTLVPIVDEGRAMGVLFLRAGGVRGRLDERELAFCQTVANATAVSLRNAREVQRLRAERQAVRYAHFEAERRVRLLERYADLFVSSADGMVVLEHNGRVLFANPRAAEITGWSEAELRGAFAWRAVHPDDRGLARRLRKGFRKGEFPVNMDLRIAARDKSTRILSLSTSALLRDENAVLVTFRDVTEDRRTAAELVRTKEFLSALVEGSADPVIAAGLDGVVRIFNGAAERLMGYSRDEVVGVRSVRTIYPEGLARTIMKRIREAPDGRVSGFRAEVLARDGERIPIMLSAALVSEGGVAVATVGVFSDLRERLRMEERLRQAQTRLAQHEKQSVVSELAGAAAHELNQPLTAMQVAAELLKRKGDDPATVTRTADLILQETERMARTIHQLGNITRYETRPYVGGAVIVDLDRSAEPRLPPPPSEVPPRKGEP